jgi:hypothetical protein
MEISSVSSNFTPAAQPQAQPKQAERAEPSPQQQRTQEAQTTRNDERRPPVVNTQGQTTGRIVNTSA